MLVRRSILLLLALCVPTAAGAVDGVVEINQTCAVQTGCFPGDAPGFPVTISLRGSYRLTSDLATGFSDGIFLNASFVHIDFNGFTLAGTSLGSGGTSGIVGGGTDGSFAGSARIENGAIRGTLARAIALRGANGVRVTDMQLDNSGGVEVGDEAILARNQLRQSVSSQGGLRRLEAGSRSTIVDNVVYDSSPQGNTRGLHCESACRVAGNTVTGGSVAIYANVGSVVSDNSAYEAGTGIYTSFGVRVANNVAFGNGRGIDTSAGCTISGNSVANNSRQGIITSGASTIVDNAVFQNEDDGIIAAAGSTVARNTARNNGGYGLSLNPDVAYRGNTSTGNDSGAVSSGVNVGANYCSGNGVVSASCP